MNKIEALLEWGGTKRDIAFLILSAIALMVSIFDLVLLPFDAAWIAIVLCGIPIMLEAIIGLVRDFDLKADVLVSMALVASILIGEDFAAGEVAFIMQLGGLLEDLTVAKARDGLEKLLHLTPRTARLVQDGAEQVIAAEDVKIGDILRVRPGESIPVDGVIVTGQSAINQAVMTGESLPVDKTVGDAVFSGTVNQFGVFDMEATKVGEDSAIQRMIRLVQSADAGKAKIVGLADRWATWIVLIALAAAGMTWLVTGQIIRAVTILVVFCPCALVLATPTAIMAAIGNATKHGFLVREGDALERLASVSKITFDKTGTLTLGTPQVIAFQSFAEDVSDERLYYYTASAEQFSEHPLGKAVTEGYHSAVGKALASPQAFQILPGRGVQAIIDGKEILAGNAELLRQEQITLSPEILSAMQDYLAQGCTAIYVAVGHKAIGYLALADTLRPEATEMVKKIEEAGVIPVLLTGDHENAAQHIASQLSIREVQAGCLPEDKLNYIDGSQMANKMVCMVGDGINDAPALKKACVGIAMGGIGSDIAVEAADIALGNDDL